MKLQKGKLGNINKKLLAGALALVFTSTSFVGCAKSEETYTYETNESGYVVGFNGTMSYEYLSSCEFVKVKNKIKNEEYYTIADIYIGRYYSLRSIKDIFTKQELKYQDIFEYERICHVSDYLIAYNMKKAEYTEEEVKEILNLFIKNQENETTKQKIK